MDPISNPYTPGAGTPPPELAGRDELRERVRVSLARNRHGRPTKSLLMVGLRGVGKTVLLNRMRKDAEASGIQAIQVEAPEYRSLPSILAPQLRVLLLALSRSEQARDLAQRALRALAGFARALKVKYEDIEIGIDMDPEPGLADNGVLEDDLQALLKATGEACKAADTALAMFIDELQYVPEPQLAALITSLHRMAQENLPVMLVGAGLPQLRGRMGDAKSYAERLFDFPEVGALSPADARLAIEKPANDQNVEFEPEAIQIILQETHRYPYFLQEWGKHVWNVAVGSPITGDNVRVASIEAVAALDESFFRVRFDRMTPVEKLYLRAMAELGPGPHRSGDIAAVLERKVSSLAPVRNGLISKGMVWSPNHGDTAFTVPLFDEFMRRIMPNDDWQNRNS